MQTVWEGPFGNQARFKAFSFKWPSLSSHQGGGKEELGLLNPGKSQTNKSQLKPPRLACHDPVSKG